MKVLLALLILGLAVTAGLFHAMSRWLDGIEVDW